MVDKKKCLPLRSYKNDTIMYGQLKVNQQTGWNGGADLVLEQPPCQYSVVELNERVQRGIADYKAGRRLIPHEQIKRKKVL